jgi:RNA polymerase sigma-70 factor (ECF subfamily)
MSRRRIEMVGDAHIERVARGDRDAFRALHGELYDRLFFYVYRLTRDRQASEDLLQEAFISFWERHETFSSLLAVKVYLYAFLRNKLMSRARDEANRRRILDRVAREKGPGVVEGNHLMVMAEICGQVRQAVGELPERTRRVIELCMAEMTVEEVARVMEVSVNTVKTLKKAGYQTLREKLQHLRMLLPLLLP